MYSYVKRTGVSRDVVSTFEKHRSKLGRLTRIIGQRFGATRGTGDGQFTADFEVVTIYGTDGTMRLDGTCWGYAGEGPHAVHELLLAAGVESETARKTAFETKRQQVGRCDLLKMPTRRQIDWEISLN